MKRPRGSGRVYLRGSIWWIKYYVNGEEERESSGSDSKRQAEKLLAQRLGEVATGNYIEPANRKLTIDQLYQALLDHYRVQKVGILEATEARWQRQPLLGETTMPEAGRLKKKFSGMLALALTTDKLNKYITWCQKEQGLANGTINRDLAALRRAFKLAMETGVITKCPHFPILPEAPPRKGFLEYSDYLRLKEHAHELWLKAIVVCCYIWGVRKGELVGDFRKKPPFSDGLRVCHVDFLGRTVRLDETKNGDDRNVPMDNEVYPLIRACCDGKKPNDWLFTHANGSQVKDFRKRWKRLLKEAGVRGDLLVHDNRRSAVRNMERAGVPRSVAMMITGHKTESTYRRYAIVNEEQLHDAARKVEAAKQVWAQNGHNSEKSTGSAEEPKRVN